MPQFPPNDRQDAVAVGGCGRTAPDELEVVPIAIRAPVVVGVRKMPARDAGFLQGAPYPLQVAEVDIQAENRLATVKAHVWCGLV